MRNVGHASLRREFFFRSVSLKYLDSFWIKYSYAAQPCIFWKNLSGIKTTKFKPVHHELSWAILQTERIQYFYYRRDFYFGTILLHSTTSSSETRKNDTGHESKQNVFNLAFSNLQKQKGKSCGKNHFDKVMQNRRTCCDASLLVFIFSRLPILLFSIRISFLTLFNMHH